jgi:predicted lactoylglutathione lyase
MHQHIFVNLPIESMARSQAFFRALGYDFNPEFTNDQGACLVVGENLFVMLLVKSFYQTFTSKTIADARTTSEVLVCFSCGSREEVDALVSKAVAAGGTTPRPVQDLGFMYSHGFDDLDGHTWEFVYMAGAAKGAGGEGAGA